MGDIVALLLSVVLCFGVAGLGARITAPGLREWYPALRKPWFTPPNAAFPIAWSTLFLCMAMAAFLVWRARPDPLVAPALGLFGLQLVLNTTWSWLFFGRRSPGAALVEVVFFLGAIVATTMVFFQVNAVAGWLMVPYIVWVAFATILNLEIWRLNREKGTWK